MLLSSNYNNLFLIVLVLFSSCVFSQNISPLNLFFNYSDARLGQTNVFPQNFPVEYATFGYTQVLNCQNQTVNALRLILNIDANNDVTQQNVYITPRNLFIGGAWRCFALHDARIGELTYRNFITAESCDTNYIATGAGLSFGPKSLMGLKDDAEVASIPAEDIRFYKSNIRMTDGNCHPAIAIAF